MQTAKKGHRSSLQILECFRVAGENCADRLAGFHIQAIAAGFNAFLQRTLTNLTKAVTGRICVALCSCSRNANSITFTCYVTEEPPSPHGSRQCLEYRQYRGTGHIPVYEGTYQAGSFKPRTSASISGVIVQVPAANLSAFTF